MNIHRVTIQRILRYQIMERNILGVIEGNNKEVIQMGSLANILWTVVVILVVLWLLGFVLNVAGLAASGLIHILLVIAAIVLVYNLLTGRRGI